MGRRLHAPGVVPLELWDLEVRAGETLWDARDAADFPRILGDAIASLLDGSARSRSLGPVAAVYHRVVLTGGGASQALAAHLPVPARVDADPFVGVRGARALRGRDCAVVDVGQTSIKLAWRDRRLRLERPGPASALAPLLRDALREVSDAPDLVVAVPAALGDTGAPGPSTYPDLPQALELLPPAACLVNDAELAACAFRSEAGPGTIVLVLTVGFGIGAALVTGDA